MALYMMKNIYGINYNALTGRNVNTNISFHRALPCAKLYGPCRPEKEFVYTLVSCLFSKSKQLFRVLRSDGGNIFDGGIVELCNFRGNGNDV